ncbi:hypothetical protein [Piscinibacter koreensis]|uniref:hypothetical protein n=1 Tax=Piscinibacter koreensis TaxID=2742824 RepID=UPI00158FA655|nr:hypothetical protein [Schlegelella koreensis]
MSSWAKVLVVAFVGSFAALAIALAVQGAFKAAAGALIPAALLAPALLEAWRPGKYLLRARADGSPDNLVGRVKQFRLDHPGVDGTLLLGVLAIIMLGPIAALIFRVVETLF